MEIILKTKTKKRTVKKYNSKTNPSQKQLDTRFKPGQSGNPNGRPHKEICIPEILRTVGNEDGTIDGKHTKLELVLRKVFDYALQGKPWAVQFLADRLEGRAIQKIEQSINGKMGISEAIVAIQNTPLKDTEDDV